MAERDQLRADRAATNEELYDEAFLDAMDELTREPTLSWVRAGDTEDQYVDVDQTVDQKTGPKVTQHFVKSVIEVAKGATPTVRSFIEIKEESWHEDEWYFIIDVRLTCDSGSAQWREMLSIEDKYGRRDRGIHLFDVELVGINELPGRDTDLDVKIKARWCQYGWYSGVEKSCVIDESYGADEHGFLKDAIGVVWT